VAAVFYAPVTAHEASELGSFRCVSAEVIAFFSADFSGPRVVVIDLMALFPAVFQRLGIVEQGRLGWP
jgi:hypothetical protein